MPERPTTSSASAGRASADRRGMSARRRGSRSPSAPSSSRSRGRDSGMTDGYGGLGFARPPASPFLSRHGSRPRGRAAASTCPSRSAPSRRGCRRSRERRRRAKRWWLHRAQPPDSQRSAASVSPPAHAAPAMCVAANSPFVGLELFQEILYTQTVVPAVGTTIEICAEPAHEPRPAVGSQGTDSGNDRTRTFARVSMPQGSVPASAEQTRMGSHVSKSLDSFKCRTTLTVGGADYVYFNLIEAEKNGLTGISQAALFDEGSAREPAAQRGWPLGHQGEHPGGRRLADRQGHGRRRDRLPPGPRADAGLHRRARPWSTLPPCATR